MLGDSSRFEPPKHIVPFNRSKKQFFIIQQKTLSSVNVPVDEQLGITQPNRFRGNQTLWFFLCLDVAGLRPNNYTLFLCFQTVGCC